MPQESGFFDTTADDPREYPARKFAEYFALFVGSGVFGGGEKLKVTANGKDMNVSINIGYGWIKGYMYSVYDAPLVLPIEQATTQDRIDRIVLRLDVSTPVRAIRAIVLQGLPGATPQAPAIVRSGDIYDLSLAKVLVKANTSTIQQFQVTDERLNNQVCGIVTGVIQQADTTSIFNQFQSWLNTKTAEYQKQWEDFLKTVQDEGFAPMKHTHDAADIVSGLIDTARLRGATTGQFGVCKLYDGVDGGAGAGNYLAASPLAVKQVYDEMMLVKQSVVDGKGKVAGAINDKGGGPVSANSTFDQMAAAIRGIRQATGGLDISETFLSKYNNQAGNNGGKGFINSSGNFLFVVFTGTTSTTPNMVLREVNQQGVTVRETPLAVDAGEGFMQLGNNGHGAVGEGVAIFGTYDTSPGVYSRYLYAYDLNGIRISKNSLTYADVAYTFDVIKDGPNIFTINGGGPISIRSNTGSILFQLSGQLGSISNLRGTGVWLSKTKALITISVDDGTSKLCIITRNGTSFSAVVGSNSVTLGRAMEFLSAYAYR